MGDTPARKPGASPGRPQGLFECHPPPEMIRPSEEEPLGWGLPCGHPRIRRRSLAPLGPRPPAGQAAGPRARPSVTRSARSAPLRGTEAHPRPRLSSGFLEARPRGRSRIRPPKKEIPQGIPSGRSASAKRVRVRPSGSGPCTSSPGGDPSDSEPALRLPPYDRRRVSRGPTWSPEEVARLRDLFPGARTAELAPKFGRSVHALEQKAHQLGILKTVELRAAIQRAGRLSWAPTRAPG